jgi:hypothetical protein
MRARPPVLVAASLCAALVWPAGASAQAPAGPAPATVAGSWTGWAKLANDWPGLACRYDGGPESTSVQLELAAEGSLVTGSVAIDLPPAAGSGCPALRKRYAVAEATQGPGALSFTDSGGNEWTLSVRRNGRVLQGLLGWRQGGPDEPLADGFAGPGGVRPLSRLSGEVRLQRAEDAREGGAAEALPPAAESAGAPPPPAGGGRHVGHIGVVIGANVVGLGILYGVNQLGQGSSDTGVLTCSPRVCIVGPSVNDPCYCEGNVVSGADCGTTQGGAPLNAPCDGKAVPCQATLSCNSGVCQDRDGRCPY